MDLIRQGFRSVASDPEWQLEMHRQMLRVRRFEERAAELYRDGEIPGFLHLSVGQEAVAVGACSPLRPTDGIVSTHRGHGHCLAKGVDMTSMFAELMGRSTGACRGLGGSMHIADLRRGVFGANGIVGAGLPIAAGVAAAFQALRRDDVVVAFFGEGAVSQGAFHEALNLSAVWKLPILFLCENNQFAEFSRLDLQQPVSPAERASAYGLSSLTIDGNDVAIVADEVERQILDLRNGLGPRLLEATTYRLRGHYEGDPQRYRDALEATAWHERDPLQISRNRLRQQSIAEKIVAVEAEVEYEVNAALNAARAALPPDVGSHLRYVVADAGEQPSGRWEPSNSDDSFRYMDAVREAMALELEADPKVWLAGIDVGESGGVYAVTRGLDLRFPGRVRDTPISEIAIMGLAVGGAMAGTRPIVELMYLDFLGVCLDQLLNQASKMHFMTGGAAPMSLVVRTQFAAGRSSGPQHSQSLEAILTQIPGLKVVMPAFPADAYGLMRAAIADPNPVVFIENRLLYGQRGPRPPADHYVSLGRARVCKRGKHLTAVSWSRMVHDVLAAADLIAADGIEVEVIDLRTVAPIDYTTVLESVSRTRRLLIAHEAVIGSGLGAEISARAAADMFQQLDAPVVRMAPPFTPVPYSRELEAEWLPSVLDIADSMLRLARA